jgi:hypothetical protein
MRKILWILPFAMGLASCPFESNVPLASAPLEPVDTSLMGYWYGIVKDGSDFFGVEALDISKQSDSVYAITRYGKAIKEDMILPDTAHFTGYTSYVSGQRFMNVEGTVVTITPQRKGQPLIQKDKVYYLAAFNRSNDTLGVKTITESFSALKEFKKPDQLKDLVNEFLGQHKNIYDDVYALSYKKIKKMN